MFNISDNLKHVSYVNTIDSVFSYYIYLYEYMVCLTSYCIFSSTIGERERERERECVRARARVCVCVYVCQEVIKYII